jgi:hypothetical protein
LLVPTVEVFLVKRGCLAVVVLEALMGQVEYSRVLEKAGT